jgi:hypothetical protein
MEVIKKYHLFIHLSISPHLFRSTELTTKSSPLDCVEITGMPRFVILNPSPFVTLSETKGLGLRLRVNSVKNLVKAVS